MLTVTQTKQLLQSITAAGIKAGKSVAMEEDGFDRTQPNYNQVGQLVQPIDPSYLAASSS